MCFGLDHGVSYDFEYHVADVVVDGSIGIGMEVDHRHFGSSSCVGCWGRLYSCNFIEYWEDTGATCTTIIHEGSIKGL